MSYYWDEFIKDIQSNVLPGQVVLDAGAGDCHWRKHFSSEVKYIGMDLGVGDSTADYSKLDIEGDLRKIPLEDNSVDTVISIQVFEHLPEPWKVLSELNRILRSGGDIYITCPQAEPQHQVPHDFLRYTPFGLRSLLESNGFEVIWIKPQLGNFSHIGDTLIYSAKKLPMLTNNYPIKIFLLFLSTYLRLIQKIHRPLLLHFDQFEEFQDNVTGHFVKARKL
jgi:SAM-dependent methyltransferase